MALDRRDKLVKGKREKFSKNLDNFFKQLVSHEFEEKVNKILFRFDQDLAATALFNDKNKAGDRVLFLENEVRKELAEYKNQIAVPKPRGFALSKNLRMDFDTYLEEFQILEKTLFSNANCKVNDLIQSWTSQNNFNIDKRKRLERAVTQITQEAKQINALKKHETQEVVNGVHKKVDALIKDLLFDLDKEILGVMSQFQTIVTNQTSDFDLVEQRMKLEKEINEVSNKNTQIMDRIIKQFESFYIEKNDDGEIITNDQIAEVVSEELDDLRTQVQSDVELCQLGLAVGIVHHEFNGTVNAIRQSIKELKAWSDINEKINPIYKNIKINFEHLDGYLGLFTPLNRRLNRRRESIPLMDIKLFLIDLFNARLQRHEIALKHTYGFAQGNIFGFRSSFYPVFVNLIDNAIYWLSKSSVDKKVIRLHADEFGIYVSNNGEAIQPQDVKRIFDLRFSRKPNGRGLGLSISREVLNSEGYDIAVAEPRKDSNVTFRIFKK